MNVPSPALPCGEGNKQLAKEQTMTEAKNGTANMAEAAKPPSSRQAASADPGDESTEEARLGILRAVERKEISIEEALRLLREMED